MSGTVLCRLCIRVYSEFINLFDEQGQTNEAYEIAMRYFDPKLLKPQHELDLTLICISCWSHISDFYNFQQNVIIAQTKLEDDESWMEQITIISIEETNDNEPINISSSIEADIKYSFPIVEENKFIIDLYSNVANSELHSYQRLNMKKDLENKMNSRNNQINSSNSMNNLPCPNIRKAMEYDAIIHKWKSTLECDICHSKLFGYYFLRQHFYQNHPNDQFYVMCCQRKFKNRFELVEHIRVHLNRNTYQCQICGKALSCNRNLTRHIREVHVGKMTCNSKLSKIVDSKSYFPNIKSEVKTKNKVQKSPSLNNKHLLKNSDLKIAGNLKLNRKKQVSQYHRPFKKSSLKQQNSIDYDTLIADVKSELECPKCNTKITRFSLLCQHFENEHPNKKFHILCCQRQFHNGYQILKHLQLHTDPNAFKCNICENIFSRKAYLVRHTRTLHSEKVRWFCDQCDAELKSCSGLNRHKKRCDKVAQQKIATTNEQMIETEK